MTKLQTVRKSRGMSQSQLARISGVSIRMVQHYERGEFNFENVNIHTMLRLAVALRCPLSALLNGPAAETARRFEENVDCYSSF